VLEGFITKGILFASRKAFANEDLIAKFTFWGISTVKPAISNASSLLEMTPTTLPESSKSGPPLFPGWTGDVICKKRISLRMPAKALIAPGVKLNEEARRRSIRGDATRDLWMEQPKDDRTLLPHPNGSAPRCHELPYPQGAAEARRASKTQSSPPKNPPKKAPPPPPPTRQTRPTSLKRI